MQGASRHAFADVDGGLTIAWAGSSSNDMMVRGCYNCLPQCPCKPVQNGTCCFVSGGLCVSVCASAYVMH